MTVEGAVSLRPYDEEYATMTDQPDDKPLRPDADKGREPKLVPGRMGTRMYSMAALLERIEEAFPRRIQRRRNCAKPTARPERLKLILDTTDYVLAVESVQLTSDEKADLIRRMYS